MTIAGLLLLCAPGSWQLSIRSLRMGPAGYHVLPLMVGREINFFVDERPEGLVENTIRKQVAG